IDSHFPCSLSSITKIVDGGSRSLTRRGDARVLARACARFFSRDSTVTYHALALARALTGTPAADAAARPRVALGRRVHVPPGPLIGGRRERCGERILSPCQNAERGGDSGMAKKRKAAKKATKKKGGKKKK